MKNLVEQLNESLLLESAHIGDWVFVQTRWDNSLKIVKYKGDDLFEVLDNCDCNYQVVKNNGTLAQAMWNDESVNAWMKEDDNWNTLLKKDIKQVEEQLETYGDDEEVYELFSLITETYYYEDKKPKSAKDFQKEVLKFIENSYVDGDSNYCQAIIDLKKQQPIVCGKNGVEFVDTNYFKMKTSRNL